MKKIWAIPILAILWTGFVPGCVDDQDPEIHREPDEEVDGYTMATPNGGELKRAEEGPERSALGVPMIDLSTFELSVSGLVDSSYVLNWEGVLISDLRIRPMSHSNGVDITRETVPSPYLTEYYAQIVLNSKI